MSLRRVLPAAILAAAFTLAAPTRARATDRHVPADYPTIQKAIDASDPQDNVLVAPGVYTGPGNVNLVIATTGITVLSETGIAADCVIDCRYTSAAFHLSGDDASVVGFTITHAKLAGAAAAAEVTGGWVYDCRFVDNGIPGAEVSGGTLNHCTFEHNSGCGVTATGPNWYFAIIDGCTFTRESVGLFVGVEQYAYIPGCRFVGNVVGLCVGDEADVYGGGAFEANGTAIQLGVQVQMVLIGSTVVRNGVGLVGDQDRIRIWSSTFLGNSGWAVDVGTAPDCMVTNSIFVGNAGGLRCIGDPTIDGGEQMFTNFCTIVNNPGGALLDTAPDPANWTFAMNSIVWDNGPQDMIGTYSFHSDVSTRAPIEYSTIHVAPRFVRPPSPGPDKTWGTPDDDYGNLRLRPGSPCIDRGIVWTYASEPFPETDLAGFPRAVDSRGYPDGDPDMGAYEYPSTLVIESLSRLSANVGGPAVPITVSGGLFTTHSVICWNGRPLPTTFVSMSWLRAQVTSDMLAVAGIFQVTVRSPDPGFPYRGSNAVPFTVLNRKPILASLSPASVAHGSAGFTLNAAGNYFVPGSTIYWDGAPRPTAYDSASGKLSTPISSADVAAKGSHKVTVVNPAPGGGASTAKTFIVR